MASANITVTAPVGPGKTVTALVISGAKSILFDVDREVFVIDDGVRKHTFDYETIATVTYTISGETGTVTVST